MGNSSNRLLHFEFTEFSTTSFQLSDALIDLDNDVFSHSLPPPPFFFKIIYLAVLGLCCGTQDL